MARGIPRGIATDTGIHHVDRLWPTVLILSSLLVLVASQLAGRRSGSGRGA